MKLTDLTTGTAYLVGARDYARAPGALLDTTAWISRGERSHRYDQRAGIPRLERNPEGQYGSKRWGTVSSTYGDVRGLLVVTTSGHALTEDYAGDPDDPDDPTRTAADSAAERDARVAALPEVAAATLAAIEADPMTWPTLPEGYTLGVVRPQDIVRPWAEHLESERAGREARRTYEIEQEQRAQLQRDARARLIAAVRPSEGELRPYGPWHGDTEQRMSWTDLEALCERYAAGRAGAR